MIIYSVAEFARYLKKQVPFEYEVEFLTSPPQVAILSDEEVVAYWDEQEEWFKNNETEMICSIHTPLWRMVDKYCPDLGTKF